MQALQTLKLGSSNPVVFMGEDAHDLLHITHRLGVNINPLDVHCPKVCKLKRYVDGENAAIIHRMNQQSKNLFGVFLNSAFQRVALTPNIPVYRGLLWHFEHIARQVLGKELSVSNNEAKNLFSIVTTCFKTSLQTFSQVAELVNQKKIDANSSDRRIDNAIQKKLNDVTESLLNGITAANAIIAKVNKTIVKTAKPEHIQRILHGNTRSLNELLEGLFYLQKLAASKEDWMLMVQQFSDVYHSPVEARVKFDPTAVLRRLLEIVEHMQFSISKDNLHDSLQFLSLDPQLIDRIGKALERYSEQLETFKELIKRALSKHSNLTEQIPRIEEFFNQHLAPWSQVVQKISEGQPNKETENILSQIFEMMGLVDERETISQLITTLKMDQHILRQPLNFRVLRDIRDIVTDLTGVFPVIKDKKNFEMFYVSLMATTETKQLDQAVKTRLDKFILKAYDQIYLQSIHRLNLITLDWEDGVLEELTLKLQEMEKRHYTTYTCQEVKQTLEEKIIVPLEDLSQQFSTHYASLKTELQALRTDSKVDVDLIETIFEELHFFINCSINGPKEMLKEKLNRLFSAQTAVPAAERTELSRAARRKAEKQTKAIEVEQTPAPAVQERPKAAVLDLSHLGPVQPRVEKCPTPAASVSKEIPPTPKLENPAEDTLSNLSSEASRKLRNFLGLVEKYGFYLARTKGSHNVYKHQTHDTSVSIPQHDTLKIGTARTIMKRIFEGLKSESSV